MKERLSHILDFALEFVFEKQYGAPKMRMTHVHPQYELYFFPKAIAQRLVINNQEEICRTACIVISKPYTVHSMVALENCPDDLERYVVYFDEPMLYAAGGDTLFGAPSKKSFGLLFKLTDEEAKYYGSLIKLLDPDGEFPLRKSDRERYIPFLLGRIFTAVPRMRIFRIGSGESYIQEVMRFIYDSIFSDTLVTTDGIAKHFSVSRSKIERDFKASVGNTVREFINMCRINRIMILIRSPENYKMSEIAEKCAFKSETYLFAFFKKFMGYSPKEYRNNKNIENNGLLSRAAVKGEKDGKNYLYGCR